MQFNNYYGTVSMKHKFKIVFADGTDTIVYSTIAYTPLPEDDVDDGFLHAIFKKIKAPSSK